MPFSGLRCNPGLRVHHNRSDILLLCCAAVLLLPGRISASALRGIDRPVRGQCAATSRYEARRVSSCVWSLLCIHVLLATRASHCFLPRDIVEMLKETLPCKPQGRDALAREINERHQRRRDAIASRFRHQQRQGSS